MCCALVSAILVIVVTAVCLTVCLCLSRITENLWTDFDETACVESRSQYRHKGSSPRLAEQCLT